MNNTAKHTPGPWVYDAEEGTVYDVPSDGDAMMLMVSDAGNAHLIAAAPAMHEALSELVKYLREEVADEALDTWAPVFKAAMALAQAEGRHHE